MKEHLRIFGLCELEDAPSVSGEGALGEDIDISNGTGANAAIGWASINGNVPMLIGISFMRSVWNPSGFAFTYNNNITVSNLYHNF